MEIRKPLIFIKDLPKKLNRFYFNKSKLRLVVKNKAKKKKNLTQLQILINHSKNLSD